MRVFVSLVMFVLGALVCAEVTAQSIKFTDVSSQSGIDFEHTTGASGEGYLVEGVSAGLATLDFDGDGLLDIYFCNGAPLRGTVANGPVTNRLFRNEGGLKFKDVTDQAGVGDAGYALGVGVADFDGNGYPDIYVNNFGANVLYRNNGDGTFTDVTETAGVACGQNVGAGVGFFDMEGDGDLDLYVGNYVDFSYETHVPIVLKGKNYTAGPQYYNPVPDTLYRNNGDGTFTDVSQESGLARFAGPSMGLMCVDIDNDNDTDVYVCNDGKPNFLFVNDGDGHFQESAFLFGVACDLTGQANSSMGVDCGDYNNDGQIDIISTNYQAELPNLYRNLGGGFFEDATSSARLPYSLFPHVNWGTSFTDFDNDGDEDVFIACGHFDRIETIDDRTQMKIRNYVLRNDNGKFADIGVTEVGLTAVKSSRASAAEDLDNDGDIDVVVLNSNDSVTLLRNDLDSQNAWICLKLVGPGRNKDAVGAVVSVGQPQPQKRYRVSGRGYQSHFGSILHFGLGEVGVEKVQVSVRWPDGRETEQEVSVNKLTRIEHSPDPGDR
ncbi:MAG TPA: hypothetical protein DDW52_10270 [Planctomycetaceae bacterium]|nr:hypothetical protein [Planctomycetaceae bacterium]